MQGIEQAEHGHAAWLLSPTQEHKYDALAAFDAGHLQEAQHAFDLSVWSDLKNDKGILSFQVKQLICRLRTVFALEADQVVPSVDVPCKLHTEQLAYESYVLYWVNFHTRNVFKSALQQQLLIQTQISIKN